MTKDKQQPAITAMEERARRDDARLFSPSAARNVEPITKVFIQHMPDRGVALEIGAGTGEHAVALARALPGLEWRTGDPDKGARASIAAWIDHAQLPNLSGPHAIDVTEQDWGEAASGPLMALISINMVHIAPFAAAKGLFAGAGRYLAPGGALFLYGPFSRGGRHTAASNEAFDAQLKAQNPAWSVRDLEADLAPLARQNNLTICEIVEMPANNLSLIYKKAGQAIEKSS